MSVPGISTPSPVRAPFGREETLEKNSQGPDEGLNVLSQVFSFRLEEAYEQQIHSLDDLLLVVRNDLFVESIRFSSQCFRSRE